MSKEKKVPPLLPSLPETGFLRLKQILGDKKASPPSPAIFPVSAAAWWAGIKDGRYPPGVKLGPRTTAWSVASIRQLIEDLEAGR